MKKVTIEFLEKIKSSDCGYGNVSQLSKDVFSFTEYNFLPGTNPHGLDGHYSFAVNITNFKYVYWKDSDYGGLTYVRDNPNKVFIPVHKSIKKQIEGIIARKLLGSYWYDRNAVNSRGKNLFSDGTPPEKAGFGFNDHIVRYNDGWKLCLITDWAMTEPDSELGKLDPIEKMAVDELQE